MQNNNILGAMALTCAAFMYAIPTMAASMPEEDGDAPVLVVRTTADQSATKLAEIVSIKYTATDMVINLKGGEQKSIPMADVTTMNFSTVSASIGELFGENGEGKSYVIHDLAGNLIADGVIKNGRMTGAPALKGPYVITIGKKSKVVILK